jgi:hypothetical protein
MRVASHSHIDISNVGRVLAVDQNPVLCRMIHGMAGRSTLGVRTRKRTIRRVIYVLANNAWAKAIPADCTIGQTERKEQDNQASNQAGA